MRSAIVPTVVLSILGSTGCTNPLRDVDRIITPPARIDDDRVGASVRAWPILEITRGRNYTAWDVLWPVFSREAVEAYRSTSVIWPLVRHESLGPRWTFQFRPLWWSGSDREGGKGHAIGVPLYWDFWDSGGRTIVAIPLLFSHSAGMRRATVAFPLWWDFSRGENRFWFAFPFAGEHATPSARTLFVLPPVYFRHADSKGTWVYHWFIGPLAHYRSLPDESFGYFFPLLYHSRAGGKGFTVGFPLWWGFRFGEKRATTIGFPLWWDFTYADDDYDRILFPVWWEFRAPARRTLGILPPIFVRWSGPGGSETRILWKLFEDVRTREKHLVALNPLFAYETNRRGDVSWSVLGWLYQYIREEGHTRHKIFWVIEI